MTETKNFDVGISVEGDRGYFEHHRYGEEVGGGLWFEDGELIDYDGTFELPMEVLIELRDNRGVKIDKLFYKEPTDFYKKYNPVAMLFGTVWEEK